MTLVVLFTLENTQNYFKVILRLRFNLMLFKNNTKIVII